VRLELLDQKPSIFLGQTTASIFARPGLVDHTASRRVFMNAVIAHVIDRNDYQRINQTFSNKPLGGFVDAPFHTRERRRRIEYILTIVHVEHWVTDSSLPPIATGQINQNV